MKLALQLGLTCCSLCLLLEPAAAQTLRTVALSGQHAPGTPEEVLFDALDAPVLNLAGNVAFASTLVGPGVDSSNDAGMWTGGVGTLDSIAREGQHAPGTPDGAVFDNFFLYGGLVPLLNDAGQVAFRTQLAGTGVIAANNSGIWSGAPGALTLVAHEETQAPNLPAGVEFGSLGSVFFNGAGQTEFGSGLRGTGVNISNDSVLWSEGSGSLSVVLREGDAAPGTPDMVRFFGTGFPTLNSAGHTAFLGAVVGPGVDYDNDKGFWTDRSGSLELVAREGNPAPGMPAGVNFDHVAFGNYNPDINASGRTAFVASVRGGGVTASNNTGIWSEGSGSLALAVRSGEHAPGTPTDVNFVGFEPPRLNAAGKIAFQAHLTGNGVDTTNDDGIWSDGFGALELVARKGDHAPGTPDGVLFDASTTSFSFNALGQTAFLSSLRGAGVDSTNDQGIWAADVSGMLHLIARDGDLLEVAPGDFRTIAELEFLGHSGLDDGRGSGFNERGELAFLAHLTDGTSGIFISDLVAVPEPSSEILMLAAVVAWGLAAARRRRQR